MLSSIARIPDKDSDSTGGLLVLLQAEEASGSCAVERSGSHPLRPGLGHASFFFTLVRGFTADLSLISL